MINLAQVQQLLSYDSGGNNVLSLYLDADTSQETKESIKLQVRNLLRDADLHNSKSAMMIERYLDHSFNWASPGLALFCCGEMDYFEQFETAVPFRNRLRVSPKPYIKPLAHLLDFYAHYGVILVDRVGARFFAYHLGQLEETEGIMGEETQNIKKGSGSSAHGMRGGSGGGRHEEEVANRNLREAAQEATNFFTKNKIRRLFIGGTIKTVSQFQELLPKQLQSCIAGTFAMDMTAGEHEVRAHSLGMLREVNAKREKQVVAQLMDAEAKGGNGVIGLDDTLQAVNEKRVQTLVISDGYRSPGYFNESSGFVVANLAKSPISPDELTAVDDVVDIALNFTMNQGGHAEVVNGNSLLEENGRIGAILRY